MITDRKGSFQDLNALLIFGAFTVLLIHILGFFIEARTEYPWNDNFEALSLILLRFGRSLFIFATGMLLFYWYKHRAVDWSTFWLKRWHVIVLPYVIWTAIYTFVKLQSFDPAVLLPAYTESLLTGSSFYHLYYIPLYLQLNLLFFLSKHLIERFLNITTLLVIFAVQMGIYLFFHFLFVDKSIQGIDWNASFGLSLLQYGYVYGQNYVYMYLFYFSLGAFAGLNADVWKVWLYRLRYISLSVSVFTTTLIAGRYLSGYASYEESLNIFDPLYFVYTISFIATFYPLSAYLGTLPILSEWLAALAKYNMAIYIVHPFVLFIMESYVIFRFSWSTPVIMIFLFVITIPLSIFLYKHTLISYWRRGRQKEQKRRKQAMQTHRA